MKILALDNVPSSHQGGMEWSTLEVCRGLAQRGHEIHLVYQKEGDFLPIYQQFCKSIVRSDFRSLYSSNPLRFSVCLLRSILPVLKINPDVIYIQKYHNAFFGGTLAQLKNVPFVCHLRCFPPPRAFRRQFGMGLKSVTRFIAVSEATRTAYFQAGFDPKTIEVVYNGIGLNKFVIKDDRSQTRKSLDLPPDAFVVFYAGRIDPPKNIEMLIQAFAQLSLPPERARLMIAGSPVNHATKEAGEKYIQELKSLCEKLGISSCVHWLGRRSDLPELYRAADVTVLPSMLPDTFGRTLAESMACGTPALGLRYGGIPEVLSGEFEKFRIEVGDTSGLTSQLEFLNGWQQKDPMLGQRCRAYAEERFSVERTITEVESALEQAVKLGAMRLGPSPNTLQKWGDKVSSNPKAFAGFVAKS